jgi:nicotinamidase-related amidase
MKALLVIDMLKDFIEEDGALYCGQTARRIIPFVKQKIDEFRKNEDLIIYICDSHEENDLEFRMFARHSVKGTRGAEIIDELPVEDSDIFIRKSRFSAFYNTNLDQILDEKKVTEVHVVGVCTSICVMDTVGDLRNRDYEVRVYAQGVANFDPEAHEFSLKRMEKTYGAQII